MDSQLDGRDVVKGQEQGERSVDVSFIKVTGDREAVGRLEQASQKDKVLLGEVCAGDDFGVVGFFFPLNDIPWVFFHFHLTNLLL